MAELILKGDVKPIAVPEPNKLFLKGLTKNKIEGLITIKAASKERPFGIEDVRAGRGEYIDVKVTETGNATYTIKVTNTRETGGKFTDNVRMQLTGKIPGELVIPVYGDIQAQNIARLSQQSPLIIKGSPGKAFKGSVSVTPNPGMNYRIVRAVPDKGDNIEVELKENNATKPPSYRLIVKNKRKIPGSYTDIVRLKTVGAGNTDIPIAIEGHVLIPQVATITPRNVVLQGSVKKKPKAVVTITVHPQYPFKITEIKKDENRDYNCTLSQQMNGNELEYRLTVFNTRKKAGLYHDEIKLITTSPYLRQLMVPVTGMVTE